MFHIILFQPEIPPNTGTILRLGAASGVHIHLIEPLGFTLSDKGLQRAGMDYCERVHYHRHINWDSCQQFIEINASTNYRAPPTFYAMTTKASRTYTEPAFSAGDAFVFGPETRGLPESLLTNFPSQNRLRIPMMQGERSINLALSVGIITYEALRQHGFNGLR